MQNAEPTILSAPNTPAGSQGVDMNTDGNTNTDTATQVRGGEARAAGLPALGIKGTWYQRKPAGKPIMDPICMGACSDSQRTRYRLAGNTARYPLSSPQADEQLVALENITAEELKEVEGKIKVGAGGRGRRTKIHERARVRGRTLV